MCYKPVKIRDDKTGQPIYASCRQCWECKQTRANEWAVRCSLEQRDHDQSCFITLTYKDNPLILDKTDLQKFIKRLRKQIEPQKIRYFAAGEYGDKSLRPHFHVIIFGYDFLDRKYQGKSNSDMPIFTSKQLEDLWTFGLCTVQDVTPQSIKYCALYSSKTKRKGLPPWLWDYPEFNTMSQRLGIEQIINNIDTYLLTDEIYLEGFAHQIPKLVLDKILYRDPEKYANRIPHRKKVPWLRDVKEINEYDYSQEQENKQKQRLAEKKKLHTKVKEL